MTTDIKALIAEARAWAALIGTKPKGARELFNRLADALEVTVREMRAIDAELDRARANGTVYTYGNIQHRLRVALSRTPEHPKEGD